MHAQPVPQVMRTACIPSSTRSFRHRSVAKRRKDVCESVSLVCSFLRNLPFELTSPAQNGTAERSSKKDPTQYLLTVEQMVENDYPVPSYLADVFSKPDGWIETPEADPDADVKPGTQSVYAIDCEMVGVLSCVLRMYTEKDELSSVPHRRWQGADPSLHHRLCNQQGCNGSTCQTTKSDHRLSYSVRSRNSVIALFRALTLDIVSLA